MLKGMSISRKTLHSEIADLIREMIVRGELEPGSRIPEKTLCEQFEISRTPLREALKVLATEGMIVLLPQRGARVATLTDDELFEIFPIIASLEGLAGEIACQHITDDELANIEQLHNAMLQAYQQLDRLEYSRLNREIHLALFAAARNQSLIALYHNLELRIRNIRHTIRQLPQDWQLAVQEHEEILRWLREKNAGQLAMTLRKHVMSTANAVRNAVNAPAAGHRQ
ncbi:MULTISPECIES: GntR family transcriptional regulator [Brenneria]|uniref:GntR family transcriptional regulator n=1 Tax=Brenneria nigrifluens DSM 30175 = ATCC 13028 TaxID=1121120 RepID=A0A2U1URE6_9GAMM|nr:MULTISPECIES: GntR family transcriptional regulator [Brenneria]EHD22362.1 transcriptional regulator, GntR family [Brenneria sp. EniD312]PWC24182.1 GntR family transcriptional regulator [Brenneria nigrifluens DSM 30175 = ATCC 13028]QCR05373.1 GntR family transcriptional regulator [Brenneria nigrifluens DSM 30175 = ATCC 13028]